MDKFKYIGVVVRAVTRVGRRGGESPLENVRRPEKIGGHCLELLDIV